MFNPVTQYIFTAIVFVVAVIYVFKIIRGNKKSDNNEPKKPSQ